MKSYRPVSHLTFISKVLETAVKDQLLGHFERNNLVHGNQSAYRSGHSVETTLMDIHSEIAHALDEGKSAFLVLLDLSAAFDTISHSHLLKLLKNSFGVGGTVLSWIQSYLSSRSTSVKIRSAFSETRTSSVGVPQGSVLGPVLFNCVMSPLAHLLEDMGVLCHIYADDTQFLVTFDKEEESAARIKISEIFGAISKFMISNSLKLNADKTVFMPFTRSDVVFDPLVLDSDTLIQPSVSTRNLGVVFDRNLAFKEHVSELRRSCFFHLKRIKAASMYIPQYMLATLIHAFVTSRLDFCNTLFYNLPGSTIDRIQVVQNSCAKFLTRTKRFDSASEQLKKLHWLPINFRIKYKLMMMAHKVIHPNNMAIPKYISKKIKPKKHERITRSANAPLINKTWIPNLKTVGDSAYDFSMPTIWNKLPAHIRLIESFTVFKTFLKLIILKKHSINICAIWFYVLSVAQFLNPYHYLIICTFLSLLVNYFIGQCFYVNRLEIFIL